jgi:hypothetical protein
VIRAMGVAVERMKNHADKALFPAVTDRQENIINGKLYVLNEIPAKKLSPTFHGPYKVLEESNDTVKFRTEQGIKHNISKDRLLIFPVN